MRPASGEAPAAMRVGELLDAVASRLTAVDRARLTLRDDTAGTVALPRVALAQALGSLVRNALDAPPGAAASVELSAHEQGGALVFLVEDRGAGMDEPTLAHAGEPYFTTKGPGRGLGLGVFLARSVAEQLGGRLAFDSVRGRGTRVLLEVPLARSEEAR